MNSFDDLLGVCQADNEDILIKNNPSEIEFEAGTVSSCLPTLWDQDLGFQKSSHLKPVMKKEFN